MRKKTSHDVQDDENQESNSKQYILTFDNADFLPWI